AVCRLPEVDAGRAAAAFADFEDLDRCGVIAGAGTTEFLYLLPRAAAIGSALVVGPTYADYADALAINGVKQGFFMRESPRGFALDTDRLKRAAKDADAVFLCNPNNPTGGYTDTDLLADLARALPDTLFVMDESYLPFVPGAGEKSLARADLPNVVVLRSLSKMYCIPGLRVGFCAAPKDLAQTIRNHCPPWSVNAQAQQAVIYIAQNQDTAGKHEEKTRQYLKDQRAAIGRRLAGVTGLRVHDSDATFILLEGKNFTAAEMAAHMLDHRLLIRNCENFKGLDNRFFRISVQDPVTNARAAELIAGYAQKRAQKAGRENQ
ncbi:MAG: aminotransferase class I/II-fold pyridoxal phosphate-dependent enzyme, partial [Desulfobacterales bacterium]|nr:aminotransferase class I/II-fold pyridoxal phosphate-dependent enzyme [Desulfobacterales bacterium]